MTRISLVVAVSQNGVIGRDGGLPWHLSSDLKLFKAITMGKPIIMGRKTWESLPPRFRPLPGRMNIVISRSSDCLAGQESSALRSAQSLEAALAMVSESKEVWVIGGAQIYAQALPLANKVVVTKIDAHFDGDAFAPKLGSAWVAQTTESHIAANGLPYAFSTFQRTQE